MNIDLATLIHDLSQFGAWGVLVAYMAWDRICERKDRRRDTEAREKLAVAMNTLAMIIQGRPHV